MEKVFIGIDFSKLFFDTALLIKGQVLYNQFSNDQWGCMEMIKWMATDICKY